MLNLTQSKSDHSFHIAELYQWFNHEWQDVEPLITMKSGLIVPTPILALENECLLGGLVFTRFLSPLTNAHALWINAVFVKPEYRHRGIGSRLIRFAETVMLKQQEPELLVYTHIPALYEKLGWTHVEKNDDHVVMQSARLALSSKL
ncbi:GNAT family N-acetyltransferase [Vibrio sp. 10N.261.51.F12]|uniref:GNAT family N-acetyltransferase n=1 Tax=Vibrio sp. 10N.261.51.F12 TaxID=3229679 RepID=UPI003551AACA